VNLNPPVGRFSPAGEIADWIEELERLAGDPALQDEENQAELRAHLNDARTWLAWDLHRKVAVEGREVTAVLRDVGAHDRRPGDPPPSDSQNAGARSKAT
jgi:hypothetical protein